MTGKLMGLQTVGEKEARAGRAMLDRLRPYEDWAASLDSNDPVHQRPGGAQAFYDQFHAALKEIADGSAASSSGWIKPLGGKRLKAGGKPRAPRRECTDETVIARLQECAGMRYQSGTLALYFKVPTVEMTARLRRLVEEGRVRSMRAESHTLFFLPTKEELASEALRYPKRFSDVPEWRGAIRTGRVISL